MNCYWFKWNKYIHTYRSRSWSLGLNYSRILMMWFLLLEWTVPWGWFDSNNYRDEVNSTNGNTNLCRLLIRAFQRDAIFCRLVPRTQTLMKQALPSPVSPPRAGQRGPLISRTWCSWGDLCIERSLNKKPALQIKYWCIPKQINALMNSELCQWAEHLWKSFTKLLFLKLRCLCADWIVPVRYVQEKNHELKGFTLWSVSYSENVCSI